MNIQLKSLALQNNLVRPRNPPVFLIVFRSGNIRIHPDHYLLVLQVRAHPSSFGWLHLLNPKNLEFKYIHNQTASRTLHTQQLQK